MLGERLHSPAVGSWLVAYSKNSCQGMCLGHCWGHTGWVGEPPLSALAALEAYLSVLVAPAGQLAGAGLLIAPA